MLTKIEKTNVFITATVLKIVIKYIKTLFKIFYKFSMFFSYIYLVVLS